MISVDGLSKSFGALAAVRDLTFEAAPGSVTSIIGPNGAGKSTAFNLMSGAIRPDRGTVRLDGRDVTGLPPYVLAHLGIARSFQITNLFFDLTVFENVRLACQTREPRRVFFARVGSIGRPAARAAEILEAFGLADAAEELAGNLSHGDQRRLEVAVCMATDPAVLMLDEPTQGMSPAESMEIDELIRTLSGRTTVLLIEHDIELVMGISDHVMVMHQGAKLFEGAPAEVRSSRAVQEAYLGGDDAVA